MSGYRSVNFSDLCRLCSGAGNNNIQIFNDDSLQRKITECLPIQLNDKDKLPKVICTNCLEYIEIFSEFRQSCTKAQKMLESCLNTSKLRNGGQVYIKDEVPAKKVLKPIQSPSTKLMPNLCNIVTSTPTKQMKKNILTSPNQTDSLSNIMQIVGIQSHDEVTDNMSVSQNIQPQSAMQPQYTFTLDGGTLKSGQIHYKIENTGSMSQQQIVAKNVQDTQTQQLDEFLKLSKKPLVLKKNPVAQAEEPKNKKPKFNLILTSPQKQKTTQMTVGQGQKSFAVASSLNTPQKQQIQIHNIEKIMPAANQTSPTKQLVLPIMMRNDANRTADAAQIISQALAMSSQQQSVDNKNQTNPPFAYVQMKIQPNADGQLTLTPASAVPAQQQIQLALSPQQFQQLSFQQPAQQAPALSMQQQPQITVTQLPAQEQTDSHTQTPSQPALKSDLLDDDSFGNQNDDFFYLDNDNESTHEESQEKVVEKQFSIVKKKPSKADKKAKEEDLTELQSVQVENSVLAKKQLNQLTSFNIKREQKPESDTEKLSDLNLTNCDVCKKTFKRKEFLMQHLKSHIGLRPFKCDDPSCNKSFSRKEHLLRHVVSHTGQKQFTCDVCKKLFSRKDNLNKHRRIHPETGQQGVRHSCPTCGKGFSHRAQLAKHQPSCDGKTDEIDEDFDDQPVKEEKSKSSTVVKKTKTKTEKKPPEAIIKQQPPAAAPTPSPAPVVTTPQQQIVTILQPQQQQLKIKTEQPQQQQQIIISMAQAQAMFQAQQQKNNVFTFPGSLVLNNGTFMTNSGEVVGNFKFENQ